MGSNDTSRALTASLVLAAMVSLCIAVDVTYDRRGLVIDGKRRVLVSGSIHYPRSTPEMWPDLIQKSKEGGLDIIETYVFWDMHEPVRGQAEMRRFVTKIVSLMKQENLYAAQGGPIILSQIENEYGNIDWAYGPRAKSYIEWAADLATSMNAGVPWVMCQQNNAPQSMVNSITATTKFVPQPSATPSASLSGWSWFREPVGISSNKAFELLGLMEQINTTADKSDYLWYSLRTQINPSDPLLRDGSQILLHIGTLGHVFHAFVNGRRVGSGNSHKNKASIEVPVTLEPGTNRIDLLVSYTIPFLIKNYGAYFDLGGAGITGPVQFKGLSNGSTIDLSSESWTYQIGLKGEEAGLYTGSSPLWLSKPALPKYTPLTWYKTTFSAPSGNSPVAMEFNGMQKGQAWINGQSIGRYWPASIVNVDAKCSTCNYRGSYDQNKCLAGCGKPTQQYYHVPRSWLKPSGNVLVMLEEIGGDPTRVSLAAREIGPICARVSETFPAPIDLWSSNHLHSNTSVPILSLECPSPNQVISELKFVSFGNPHGSCGSFTEGRCRSRRARRVVHKACAGKARCSIEVSVNNLGDPCPNVTKSLAVQATCA
ncbi:Beta-galactosidase 8 isoform 1 [Dorcoceras hygrometricum]|uniref:Beta-galactosidase n=1 Tax=Dorcoceras hygrometricum TaxID=472368 RepID=A0A2Z7BJU7_9LAMI|nr:Beta-galactosidase 8 isoform 1 [Dorcoceras hygrometricum]